MRVLVTGGAGFIGSHVVDECLAAGYEVAVVDDLSSGRRQNLPEGVALYQVDGADAAAVKEVFRQVKPDYVSHQAAQISVSQSVREPAACFTGMCGSRQVKSTRQCQFCSTGRK